MTDRFGQTSPLRVGDTASHTRTITDADVVLFAKATGDTSPVHLDEEVASASVFGERVAHGMLTASLVSAVLGTQLPGPGTIDLGQTLRFRRPVHLGDTVTATVTVQELDVDAAACVLSTTVTNQVGRVVLEGEARVQHPSVCVSG